MLKTRLLLAAVASVTVVAGCTGTPGAVGPAKTNASNSETSQNSSLPTVTVSEGGEIVTKDEEITLTKEVAKKFGVQQEAAAAFPYDLRYVSQVPPVKVGATTVQANDILICRCGTSAFIAYNTAGDQFDGAIQIIDTKDKAKPKILREIKLPGVDVNALYYDGDWLYFGGQANPDVWGFKSYLGRVNMNNPDGAAIAKSMIPLRSHAVTSITKYNNLFYVGVGARDGGVEVLDANMVKKDFQAFPDVRSVDFTAQGVVALGGTIDNNAATGQILTLGKPANTISLPNFNGRYAKATLEIDPQGYAHVGLSAAGYQVYNPASKNVLFSLPNPTNDVNSATNGVSTDGDLAFLANGEYGFRVVAIKDRTQKNEKFGALAGYHQLKGAAYDGKSYSANFLRYKSEYLFVATGLGGVNLYSVTKR